MASRRRSEQVRRQSPGLPRNAQDEWFDGMIRHQIGLLRFQKGLSRRVNGLLDATEKDLRRAIRDRLRRLRGTDLTTTANIERMRFLLREVEQIRDVAHTQIATLLPQEMTALAMAEATFLDGALRTVVPVQLNTTLPTGRRLRAIVTHQPFEGRTLKHWVEKFRRDDLEKIANQIRVGLTQGESIPEITRRVVGTRSLKGRDGITAFSRRDAEAIIRTTANGIANKAAEEYFVENEEFFDDVLFVATLDGNTTPICRSLDGKRYKINEGKFPPLHVRCRSRRVSVLDAEALGRRPSKPVNTRRMLREFSKSKGWDRVPRSRKDLPHGTKGEFDAFRRTRTRELIGRVPAKVDYETWLRRQPVAFQEDVLGKAKARLFRRGDLKLTKFVDESGAERTLSELARSDADAFVLAGLDPERFL
jgi:SPP1 gp7 family putative phage head morphogenesis protein